MSGLAAYLTVKTLALALAVLWGLAACAAGFIRGARRGTALWILSVLGVPVLGGLTYLWGPGPGVGAFALGVATLRWAGSERHPTHKGVPAE